MHEQTVDTHIVTLIIKGTAKLSNNIVEKYSLYIPRIKSSLTGNGFNHHYFS